MRRGLWLVLLAPMLVSACSASIPRLPAAYSPPPATPTPEVTAPPANASGDPSAAPSFDTSAWTKLAPDGESFTILMPGKAESTSGKIATPGGDATQTTWLYNDAAGKRSFGVTRVRMSGGAPPASQAKGILDQAGQAVASAVGDGAEVKSQTDMTVGSNPARRVVIESAKTRMLVLIVFVGGQVFTPYVGMPLNATDDGAAEAFLASFALA